MRALGLVAALALLSALAVAQPLEPWRVELVGLNGTRFGFFDPGERVWVTLQISFPEVMVAAASFRLYAYRERGVVAGYPFIPTEIGNATLPPDVYAGNVTLRVEGVVPSDVYCSAPVYIEGYVIGRSERTYAVIQGREQPFVYFYYIYVSPACHWDVDEALEFYKRYGETLQQLNATLESLRSENRQLKARLEEAERRLETAGARIAQLESQLDAAGRQREAAERRAAQLESELEAARGERARLESELEAERARSRQLLVLTCALGAAAAGAAILLAARGKRS
jgi:hypothetical protein